jgi:hypothetical protein
MREREEEIISKERKQSWTQEAMEAFTEKLRTEIEALTLT